jgi:hypothetical protein
MCAKATAGFMLILSPTSEDLLGPRSLVEDIDQIVLQDRGILRGCL